MRAIDANMGFFPISADSFLHRTSPWNQQVAEALAQTSEIWPLTEDHWAVIDFVRGYYAAYSEGPRLHRICKSTGLSLKRMFELFPCENGITWGVYHIAGLP